MAEPTRPSDPSHHSDGTTLEIPVRHTTDFSRCCECGSSSSCKTKRCACFLAGRECTRCTPGDVKCSNRVGRNFRHDRSTVPVSTNHTQDSPSLRLSSQNINLDVNLNLNNLENETLPNTTPPPPLYRLPLRQIPPPQKSPPNRAWTRHVRSGQEDF